MLCSWLILRFVLCLVLGIAVSSICQAQEEEPVFSAEDALSAPTVAHPAESPTHPATAYWKITVRMAISAPTAGNHVQMLLPLSDGRQSVLSRRASVEGVTYREESDGLNLWGHWLVNAEANDAPSHLAYEYTVQIADARSELPQVPFPTKPPFAKSRYLQPSPSIQSDTPQIRTQAKRLTKGKTTLPQVVHALYSHIAALPAAPSGEGGDDALAVLTTGRGGRAGKTRALVALLRASGVPARVVGGIRLGDSAKKRTTISWAEALLGETWVPMDPAGGYFAWLPNTYLALYRNDLPLLVHTRQVPVEYSFTIRQVTRSEALVAGQPVARESSARQGGVRHENERVHTVATYVEHPVANVVLVNDNTILPEVAERILAEARDHRINVALLSADFESSSYREQYLPSLLSDNLTLIREADLLVMNSQGAAGLYALLKQGETGIQLTNLHVVVAGEFFWSVGEVLGAVIARLLNPKEVVLIRHQTDLTRLWDLAQVQVHARVAVAENIRQQETSLVVVTEETVEQLSWWRQQVVALWAVAVRSQISLPALNFILVLPLIAFFLVIIRNVIGLETFGTFSPMLLSLAFLTTGLGWGLTVFAVIVGLGTGLRFILQGLRLHLVSRVAILIAVVAVSMVGMTVLGAVLGVGALSHASIFPMVIMANTIENFTNTQMERGTGEALRLTCNTLLVATCSYLGIEETGLKPLVLTFPEVLLGVIAIELLLGRWRGLRLLEYVRFYRLARAQGQVATEAVRKVSAR